MRISSKTPSRRAVRHGAVAVVGLALCGSAWALGLGRVSLQSVRGEALRAEVEITSLSAEEAAGLSARIAPAEVFERAGAAYSPVLAGAQVSLQRGADGRPVLRISSEQPVQESFLDLVLELSWPSGRATREYTLLFDVPRAVAEAPAARAAPLLGAAPEPAQAPAPAAPQASGPAPAAGADAGRYVVKRGDTLSGVASRLQPEGVSLEQMLVALFRGNPHAFAGQNMNRLRADAVLRVPTPEQAGQVARGQARQVVRIQSADFDAYRQRLAQSAPGARVEEAERRAGGAVEASVEERRTAQAAPDRLRLSRGQGAPGSQEAALAREAERREQSQRVAELSRNVDELKKLGAASPQAAREVTTPTPPAPAAAPASASVAQAAPAASAAEAPAVAASTAEAASAPPAALAAASAASATADAGPVAAQAATGFQRWSWVLAALGGVAALALLGFGMFKWRRRAKAAAETSFLESRLQPESFFGGSGGQQVDTRESGAAAEAEASQYSLSQLDAIGDVDPVAEADVYLAYGRDLQAEEILKEALRGNPQRLAIRTKLLEVYAKRHDTRAFELLAQQLFQITQGQGEDWAKARELGLSIDPENPLYAGADAGAETADGRAPATGAPSTWLPSQQGPATRAPAQEAKELDLDLGFLESVPPPGAEPARSAFADTLPPAPLQPAPPAPAETPLRPAIAAAAAAATAAAAAASTLPDDAALERDAGPVTRPAGEEEDALSELDFGTSTLESAPTPAPQPPAASPSLPFDLDALSLDLDEPSTAAVLEELKLSDFGEDADPLQRKLELAEEFRQIGDADGARDLLQEVVAQASGPLKSRAQGMLDSLV
ncbi:FimV/HubP family polar landmark protein [Azohydromonas aeria]|uniref:FimV/HubP family polar landmark protein n=1 Tax=Azohydromonas aeria TaxID=2590212 RepID=UPI001E2AB333|nr:FimV/HubP family polar landmark protein [Azohydromonas aeria]